MTLALYRKYRPKILADLLGQEMTVQILRNAARENSLAHAYLFYGPRGTGKTTAARLVSKIVNCETRILNKEFQKGGEPCNQCRVCSEIDSGNGLDVIEIDAASNRGIDEIRNLKEVARTAPISYPRKVFIVDEAHMLTGPAFNALLKTLEEPPPHVMFILATTEYEKLPATITSRAQRFAFKKLDKETIMKKIAAICKAEGLKYEADALELIAVAADGGLRDAESLLDQVHSSAPTITIKTVEEVIGRIGFKKLHEFAELLVTKNLPLAIKYLGELNESGINIVQFAKDLIHYLRRILSLKMNPELEEMFNKELTREDITDLRELGAMAEAEFFIKLIKALISAYSDMRYSPFAIVPLEVTIIECLQSRS
ncbi:MAG: DNA polymerase III subunit gamma/tau [Candidatus Liptonbacteria bacterium]|nr:DNA polymerase III subunit gamma/tau [Candidatus Liptonbacteria bacterium]